MHTSRYQQDMKRSKNFFFGFLFLGLPASAFAAIVENVGRSQTTFAFVIERRGVQAYYCGKAVPTSNIRIEECEPYGKPILFKEFKTATSEQSLHSVRMRKLQHESRIEQIKSRIEQEINHLPGLDRRLDEVTGLLKDLSPKSKIYDQIKKPLDQRLADLKSQKEEANKRITAMTGEIKVLEAVKWDEGEAEAVKVVFGDSPEGGPNGLLFDKTFHVITNEPPKNDEDAKVQTVIAKFDQVAAIFVGRSYPEEDAWVDFDKKVVWRMTGNAVVWDEAKRRCADNKGYQFLNPGEDELDSDSRDAETEDEEEVKKDLVRIIAAFDRGETTFKKMPEFVWGAKLSLKKSYYNVSKAYYFRLPLLGTQHFFDDAVNKDLSLKGGRWLGKQNKEFKAHALCFKSYRP